MKSKIIKYFKESWIGWLFWLSLGLLGHILNKVLC
jgi:hypothetical protein